MALSFLEPRITPRGNTFLHCPETPQPLKRSYSFSGYISHALEVFSEDLQDQRKQLNHVKAPCMEATDMAIHPDFVASCDIDCANDRADSLAWPDTDEEESDIEQSQVSRPTWGSEASNSSALSLVALIPEAPSQTLLHCSHQEYEYTSQHEVCTDRILEEAPFTTQMHVSPVADNLNGLSLFHCTHQTFDNEHEVCRVNLAEMLHATPTKKLAGVAPVEGSPRGLPLFDCAHHEYEHQHEISMDGQESLYATPARKLASPAPVVEEANNLPLFTTTSRPLTLLERGRTIQMPADCKGKTSPYASGLVKHGHGKSQYEVDAPSRSADAVTTLMIRNLPSNLSQPELLQELDASGFEGTYDFVYLPQSFERKESKGFAFINFTSSVVAGMFVGQWHHQRRFNTNAKDPMINVSAATLQGLEANMRKWADTRLRRIKNPRLRPFVKA